nr:hypothetical protein [Tanacetum cinerariifolium]
MWSRLIVGIRLLRRDFLITTCILVTAEVSTGPSTQPQDDTSANIVCDTPSPADAETDADTRPGLTNPRQSHVALAGPTPEPMHEDFMAIVYPKVHESLKHITKEHVHIENLPSSSRTLSSIKNWDDAFTLGDQFLNDKSTEELGKGNLDTEVESMVIVPIHQASLAVPPLSTLIIDLTPPKLVSSPIQTPVITATTKTTTTTTLPPPPPLQQQSSTDPELENCISTLEKVCANFENKHKL